jgi:hypothetical protein
MQAIYGFLNVDLMLVTHIYILSPGIVVIASYLTFIGLLLTQKNNQRLEALN